MGKSTKGSKAVTAIGIASVAHHTAINIPILATLYACGERPSGKGKKDKVIARIGPRKRPIF